MRRGASKAVRLIASEEDDGENGEEEMEPLKPIQFRESSRL